MGIVEGLLVASVVGTAGSIYEQRKAGKAQERAARAERRRAEIENVQKVRQTIRQARLAQASMVNNAAQTGGMGSSGLAGGVASVGSQLSGNLNYMASIAEENTSIFNNQMEAAKASSNAALYGSIGQLSGTIFQGYTGQTTGQYVGGQLKKKFG